jgi:hypothetical protein
MGMSPADQRSLDCRQPRVVTTLGHIEVRGISELTTQRDLMSDKELNNAQRG